MEQESAMRVPPHDESDVQITAVHSCKRMLSPKQSNRHSRKAELRRSWSCLIITSALLFVWSQRQTMASTRVGDPSSISPVQSHVQSMMESPRSMVPSSMKLSTMLYNWSHMRAVVLFS